MTRILPLVALVLWPSFTALHAVDVIPQMPSADRYAAMSEKSPFALATAAAPVVAPETSFAANWFVTGIGRLNDEHYVTIKARDLSAQFSLYGHKPHPETGIALASVNWSETIGKSTVILRKGTETAKLEFNEAELRAQATPSKSSNPPTNPGLVRTSPAGGNPVVNGVRAPVPLRPPGAPGPMVIRPGAPGTIAPPSANRPGIPGATPLNQPNMRRRGAPINPPRPPLPPRQGAN